MSGPRMFLGGMFVGPWTEEAALAFVERVEQIARDEDAKRCPMAMRCLVGLPTCATCKAAQS